MLNKLNPDFDRYLMTLHCQEPDRVPLGDWSVDSKPKEAYLGRKILTIKDEVDFRYNAGFDYVTAISGLFESQQRGFKRPTLGKVRNQYGDTTSRNWAQEHVGYITNWEQFETFDWPSVDDFNYSVWDDLDLILPKGMKAILILGNIYTSVWMYMGADVFFQSLDTNEELVAAMFERVGNIQYEVFLRVVEHPCVGAIVNNDDIAFNTGLLINPAYLRKYLFPWYKKIGDVCHQQELGYVYHSDGDCTSVMEDIIECGYHGFNPIQPNCMDIDQVKEKWGRDLCLIGNLNLDSTLTLGTPQDVRAEVYERIRTIAPGGGYMVASSNAITDYVPLENMKALIDATMEFGRYPIDLSKGGIEGKIWYSNKKTKEVNETVIQDASNMDIYVTALLKNNLQEVISLVEEDIKAGMEIQEILENKMISAMKVVGDKFQISEIYIPEMIMAGKCMATTLEYFQEKYSSQNKKEIGTVVIGSVKGDMHDIGKNLVSMMLKSQGFLVHDLGINVESQDFVQAVIKIKPDILAMCALLTSTMMEMKVVIDSLEENKVRGKVKIIVGGAPITQAYADEIGADAFAYDSPSAAERCIKLISR